MRSNDRFEFIIMIIRICYYDNTDLLWRQCEYNIMAILGLSLMFMFTFM